MLFSSLTVSTSFAYDQKNVNNFYLDSDLTLKNSEKVPNHKFINLVEHI